MAKSFTCRLVTPTAKLIDEQVTYANIPLWDGLMGILPGRAPILARLGMGELQLQFADSAKGEGGGRAYYIDGGFAKMAGNELTILAERAIPTEQLSAADAEAELKAATAKTTANAADKHAEAAKIAKEAERARTKLRLARAKKAI